MVSFFSVYFFWLPEIFPDFLDFLSDNFDFKNYFLIMFQVFQIFCGFLISKS
jgi:hypothetical protein